MISGIKMMAGLKEGLETKISDLFINESNPSHSIKVDPCSVANKIIL